MAWEDDIQKTKSILGDIAGVVQQGVDIFGLAKKTLEPIYSQSPTPTQAKTPEPISAKPVVIGGMSFDSPVVLIGLGLIAYMLLSAK